MAIRTASLALDRQVPITAAERRLVLPSQQMQQQHRQATDQLRLYAPAHAFDVFGNVVQVGAVELPCEQQLGLLLCPGLIVLLVERIAHHSVILFANAASSADCAILAQSTNRDGNYATIVNKSFTTGRRPPCRQPAAAAL